MKYLLLILEKGTNALFIQDVSVSFEMCFASIGFVPKEKRNLQGFMLPVGTKYETCAIMKVDGEISEENGENIQFFKIDKVIKA